MRVYVSAGFVFSCVNDCLVSCVVLSFFVLCCVAMSFVCTNHRYNERNGHNRGNILEIWKEILNNMTKERLVELSKKLCKQPIKSHEILQQVIMLVLDKALMEPYFGDMYSDLCVMLQMKLPTTNFVRTVRNYDTNKYYWTNDNDINEEMAGPYNSLDEVRTAARDNIESLKPERRPDNVAFSIEDYLVENKNSVKIFIGDNNKYYAVARRVPPVSEEVQSIGLFGPYRNKTAAEENASKMNSFKRLLLNQCHSEYEKIAKYDEKIEAYKKLKGTIEELEYDEDYLEDLQYARIKVKHRSLGNISFIGHLYLRKMIQVGSCGRFRWCYVFFVYRCPCFVCILCHSLDLHTNHCFVCVCGTQEKIIHECICNLSGIVFKDKTAREGQPMSYEVIKEPDEEDVECLCTLFATIGRFFDHAKNAAHVQKMEAYIVRLSQLGDAKNCSSSFRFIMCRDTVDLRKRKWIPHFNFTSLQFHIGQESRQHQVQYQRETEASRQKAAEERCQELRQRQVQHMELKQRQKDLVQRSWSFQRYTDTLDQSAKPRSISTVQISWINLPKFQSAKSLMVSVKANGDRCKVLCDLNGLCNAITEDGNSTLGRSRTWSGVLFDAEKVSIGGSPAYLCFNLMNLAMCAVPNDMEERNRLVSVIVSEMGIPNLFSKKFAQASEWESVLTQEYPFATDGLIFCSNTFNEIKESSEMCFKWKPEITIDFLLGHHPVRSSNGIVEYQIYASNTNSLVGESENDYLYHTAKLNHSLFCDSIFSSTVKLRVSEIDRFVGSPVVELKWNFESMAWTFVKIRNDKQRANTIKVVSELVELVKDPLSITHALSNVELVQSSSAKEGPYYQLSSKPGLDAFRRQHRRIKEFLFQMYAGSEILDLCCGKLSDLGIWNRNGIKTVVAIDRDEAALEIAARRVSQRSHGCSVRLICADLGIMECCWERNCNHLASHSVTLVCTISPMNRWTRFFPT
jgi:hypothetical protein